MKNWKKKVWDFWEKDIFPAGMPCQENRKFMHALTVTEDPDRVIIHSVHKNASRNITCEP